MKWFAFRRMSNSIGWRVDLTMFGVAFTASDRSAGARAEIVVGFYPDVWRTRALKAGGYAWPYMGHVAVTGFRGARKVRWHWRWTFDPKNW